MDNEERHGKDEKRERRVRFDENQPMSLPGVHRYQFFSNLQDRALTPNLNRLIMLGIAGALVVDVTKPLFHGNPATIYCYECRACYATQDQCPVGIFFQAELVVSSRVGDYKRFIANGGLKCVRCGNCQSFCVANLPLPEIFGTMHLDIMKALDAGKIPKKVLADALDQGLVGKEFIDRVVAYVQER